jgi:hypothetical protein
MVMKWSLRLKHVLVLVTRAITKGEIRKEPLHSPSNFNREIISSPVTLPLYVVAENQR